MTKDEALKLALEALRTCEWVDDGGNGHAEYDPGKVVAAIIGIQKALAQPEQEPVAWESLLGAVARGWCYEKNANKTMDVDLAVAIAKEVDALYTTPPQRKPLLASDIVTMYDENPRSDSEMIEFARAIEAAHGIKE